MRPIKTLLIILLLSHFCLPSPYAYADRQKPRGKWPDPQEMAQLPEYLQIRLKYLYKGQIAFEDPLFVKWQSKIGPDYKYLHHYAFAFNYSNRIYAGGLTERIKKIYANRMISEINFVLRHVSADLVILPEIHVKKGQALLILNRVREAQAEFIKARRIAIKQRKRFKQK
jgi:hypothetical protein